MTAPQRNLGRPARWTRSGGSRSALAERTDARGRRRGRASTPRARTPSVCSRELARPGRMRGVAAVLNSSPRPRPRRARSAPPAEAECGRASPAGVGPARRADRRAHRAAAPGGGGERMLVPMTKVRLLGRRRDVERVVDELHRLGLVEIADARASLAADGAGRGRRSFGAARTSSAASPRRRTHCSTLIADAATARGRSDPLGRPLGRSRRCRRAGARSRARSRP